MREIKFRGKRIDNGQWVYGYLSFRYVDGKNSNGFIYTDKALIYSQDYAKNYDVLWSTVGQYTGLLDKNGKEVCEGDLFEITYSNCPDGFKIMGKETTYQKVIGVVEWSNSGYLLKHTHPETKETVYGILYKILERNPKGIIGNIYENPELLPT